MLKIQPQAQVVQNATMFPVLVAIPNPGHLLKPGMNSEVRIHTGQRQAVLAVPNAALRTQRDVASGATVLGLDPQVVQQQLAAAQAADTTLRARRARGAWGGDTAGGAGRLRAGAADSSGGATFTTASGMTIRLPPGVTAEQARAAFAKMRSGEDPTPAERALFQQLRSQFQRGGGTGGTGGGGGGGGQGAGRRSGSRNSAASGYVVFVIRAGKVLPVPIRTGLSDLDYSEVTSGLTDGDTVLVLPSASLVQSQQQFKQRFQNVTGGGLPGLRQQQSQGTPAR